MLWDLGCASHSPCVWTCVLTSLTEPLPLEGGITVLPLQGCCEGYVHGVGFSEVVIYKWKLNAISFHHGEDRALSQHESLPTPTQGPTPHFFSPLLL